MTATKRKISVSLDKDIVEELEADELARRRRHRLLAEWLNEMEAK